MNEEKKAEQILGGYRITILNYAKPGEYKYQITSIAGDKFKGKLKTNSPEQFLRFIERILLLEGC